MQRYRLTKIAAAPEAKAPSADTVEQYRESLFRKYAFSPPVDYYAEGIPTAFPKKGELFVMARDNRNGVSALGIFCTSTVVEVHDSAEFMLFTTNNSIYKLEKITENSVFPQ